MIILPLRLHGSGFKQAPPNFRPPCVQTDAVSFTSKLTIGKIPNDIKTDIEAMDKDAKGVIDVDDTGYLAQVFKYKSSPWAKTYAIKKVWPNHLAKHVNANPVGQLKIEAEIYQRLKGMKNIPEFHYYSGDFSNSVNPDKNNYIVMEWVDGEQASHNGTYYNDGVVTKRKLKKLFNLLQEFEQRGVLHNDLWAANILFTKKGVNVIDFNRSLTFDPLNSPETTNLKSFKERFLNRYLSDTYEQSGERALVDLYKTTQILEADFLEKKSKFLESNGKPEAAEKLFEQARIMRQNLENPDVTKENALNGVIATDSRCGKIYAKYFEFKDGEAPECYRRLKKALPDCPTVNANIKIMSLFRGIMNLAYEHDNEDDFEEFQKIKELLDDETAYPQSEREEIYYQKFSKLTDINLEILEKMMDGDKAEAKTVFEENKEFFLQTKKLKPYFDAMSEKLG